MDSHAIRSLLSAYRAGESFAEEAHRQVHGDPELVEWWKNEQELDRLIGLKLENVAVPTGLKARLLAAEQPSVPSRSAWPRKIALLAASIVLLAVFFGSWQGLFQPATSFADYRDEMVSFIRLDPALDLETSELPRVTAFLRESGAPSEINISHQLSPIGCRTLRFRGQEVALICFRSEQGDLIHMFVVNRKALGNLWKSSASPQFTAQGEWMTATWMDDEQAYLLTTKGSRETLAKYVGTL